MKRDHLENMVKGWFVGNFSPSLYQTKDVEVGIKSFEEGFEDKPHFHKIGTEITVVVSGEVMMCGQVFKAGEIVVIEPFEVASFKAMTDCSLVVVKLPGANNDKFII